ncbi:MAG: replicative DNA helicase [Saprospiraceae bacterium]|jgi:replicative DNA helicase
MDEKDIVPRSAGDSNNNTDNYKNNPRGKKNTSDISNMVYGKVPPQSIPLEEAVLGALMLDKDAMSIILDVISPNTFYLDAHQHIYAAMRSLYDNSQPVDLLTVTEQLKKKEQLEKIGGGYYLVELTNKVASAANIEFHARLLAQKHIQRELIRVSTQIVREAYEDSTDVFDLLDSAENQLFKIAETNLNRSEETMSSLTGQLLRQIEELSKKEDGLTGVPTGFTDLDRMTSGWQPSDLIIIAARPGMGKTSMVLALARNAAVDFKKPVALFTLEMSSLQFAQRLISMEAEIEGGKLRNGKLEAYEWPQLHKAIDKLNDIPIYIDDSSSINVFELRAKCRRMKMKYDIQMVIIDYLQLMSGTSADGKNSNREQEISNISRALKSMAKELKVPVIALSQLSRAVETRGGSKKPQLSDLRESGAIEQDADMVTFIYRPEYYGIHEDENGASLKGVAEFIIAKHRHGALDTIKLKFTADFAKFGNLDDPNFNNFSAAAFSSDPYADAQSMRFQSKMNADDAPF